MKPFLKPEISKKLEERTNDKHACFHPPQFIGLNQDSYMILSASLGSATQGKSSDEKEDCVDDAWVKAMVRNIREVVQPIH